ncbi:TAT-variant-translocated molybdopterin oxidoreductase [Capnocytophaga catalasegens]|uniref:Quinol:cytochrome C oxidoreductase n=1 Tax=Capnocytophaga catalasegens TaxID=1004260 RepID=A0AAV5AYE1_9FLAO|nr:TAT-variant-translocated molybdopterin oxidoreductase [Capnocytophaga catalasegens]GIZ14704.1 quinol:cytochrome C oxidoreductase [Capnocytophaga catalasegens]GJM50552.1 quinol:cytochrome C oxidoreductase [Capnocytophaga catalasegens]GJM53617.1 quinol:cytochrome C oxidoreductase [Capnocytophaga catalasegens]
MASNKRYWRSVEELKDSSILETLKQNEFVSEIPTDEFLGNKEKLENSSTTRRDFLKYVGFTTAAAALVACEGPVKKAIPYVVLPEQIRPGIPDFYATTIADGYDFASVLVKTREGRPIKIENNREALVRGCANARVHASVLSLYDDLRMKAPKKAGQETSWENLDADILKALDIAQSSGKQIILLTTTLASPSTYALIKDFSEKYPNAKHIQYDAISEETALQAFNKKYGVRALADYNLENTDVIVSFGADFLGDWQGGGYEEGYAKKRIPKNGRMSKHIQFETNMTLSGANADKRVALTPSQLKVAFAKFYGLLNGQVVNASLPDKVEVALKKAAEQVKKMGTKAVVLTGIQDVDAQSLALEINQKLNSEAFNVQQYLKVRQGNIAQISELIADMNAGKVGVLITSNVNPLYSLANASEFENGLKKVDFSVAFSMKEDETSTKTTYTAATPHYLESWGDVEIRRGDFALIQPTIRPLFNTRQLQDALIKWLDKGEYYDYLKKYWNEFILMGASWEKALHDGFFSMVTPNILQPIEQELSVEAMVSRLAMTSSQGYELVLYSKVGMGDGQQANNPWLQEFPDPISRVSWDNYLTMSASDAKKLGFKNWHVANGALDGDYAEITANGVKLKVPVFIQPGQAQGSFGLAFGYGRKIGMKKEMQVGVNAYSLYHNFSNVQNVTIAKASGVHEYACIQLHNTLMGRGDILKETSLQDFINKSAKIWNPKLQVSLNHQNVKASSVSLWEEFDHTTGHHFNLSIDLNACTGCGACVIACHAENNVPVVGKNEVRKSRDMHWLRIDRYYSSEDTFAGDIYKKENINGLGAALTTFGEMEDPSENPQVAFQPVMCQHCNNAPCETVCPVGATSHGLQGQNHMAYNRCVGTRYCANNCPYKVRRFNWFVYSNNNEFDYNMNNDLGKMVLNPDVVVRSRGVMEKCSFCIQSTQAVILKAKREGRAVREGEFNDACACASACGTGAMVFGDVNEKNSEIAKLVQDERAYHLLEHVGTKPNVLYQVKVRNTADI